MQTYLTKSADDNSKLVFWAVKGIMNDMMSQAADSENTSKFVAFAVAAMSREKEIPSFSVPGVIRKMMEDSDLNRKAGIAAPCGNGQCSDEQCETCLSNPHLPKAEVTLSDLTRGAKF